MIDSTSNEPSTHSVVLLLSLGVYEPSFSCDIVGGLWVLSPGGSLVIPWPINARSSLSHYSRDRGRHPKEMGFSHRLSREHKECFENLVGPNLEPTTLTGPLPESGFLTLILGTGHTGWVSGFQGQPSLQVDQLALNNVVKVIVPAHKKRRKRLR
ncbi:hypothetical protein K493DRAFT_307846 [Basidiobolus meristosporus CBS 931.73]|uniref:Uncharacterized protein n=1 Tax=Basidiobolus meristosporus CBS 931.73 TaxID=1314790 RepID=A0A1Y1X9C8_9FUNG|nr:hypothetical protein K493DRAFT_307846 [Basidiobolus meristosporus CBS 931.73]|eukprot:ORX82360.1 hypothetical protein K493DRAFT_307846 [Basidiobolus meristosporus CBS 931.73]